MGKKRLKTKTVKSANDSSANPITDSINSELIAAALSSVNQTVLLKVCRLCETKDGPFLNIFEADKVTAKKIEEMLPFGIQETDGLPHKICFRCSAKVEELHEFIQKCINTQNSLHTKFGKKEPITSKTKARELWEAKLNKSNISNDDLCDAVIKKAMENIKDIINIPALTDEDILQVKKANSKTPSYDSSKKRNNTNEIVISKHHVETKTEEINSDSSIKEVYSDSSISKSNINKPKVIQNRKPTDEAPSESSSDLEEFPSRPKRKAAKKVMPESNSQSEEESIPYNKSSTKQINQKKEQTLTKNSNVESSGKSDKNQRTDQLSFDYVEKEKTPEKPFNIMDHISMIKVNNVGVLFQCKLCNRNFLKREVVEAHGCSKNGVPKIDFTQSIAKPDPPKITTVKYINTKVDGELKKTNVPLKMPTPPLGVDIEIKKEPKEIKQTPKLKPKIGPASRVGRNSANQTVPKIGMVITPKESTPPPVKQLKSVPPELTVIPSSAPSIQFPALPSLNSRYKLVPGPNNTFSLVEDKNQEISAPIMSAPANEEDSIIRIGKRKSYSNTATTESNKKKNIVCEDIIDLEDLSSSKPYPVGLFQTVSQAVPQAPTTPPAPTAFTTPAMKKQSYSIVQTGNPSKLLISTKPQTVEDTNKKQKIKKNKKHDTKELPEKKQPFSVTLEDNDKPKDPGFFTFINVDPLLQPSYVLPTDSIIQESQITTSSSAVKKIAAANDKDPYTCNMCPEKFSREKKLLAHIQSHYNKLDAEDQARAEKARKRSKKS